MRKLARAAWPDRIPEIAVLAFAVLYALAAGLYPGGTKLDDGRVGFSMIDNYWCDLLDDPTYGGWHNPARRVGVFAMVVLTAGLATFWWRVVPIVPSAPRRAAAARWCGFASAMVLPWVGTRAHDHAIDVSGLLGFVAFGCAATALGREGRGLRGLAVSAFGLALANYVLWRSGWGLRGVPLVQKGAFVAFLSWVFVVAGRARAERMERA